MHALGHLYASTLLDAGESIKALAEFLGHSDPAFTLRRYAHHANQRGTHAGGG
jgi:integrase